MTARFATMIPDIYTAEDSDELRDFVFDFDKDVVSSAGHQHDIEGKLFDMDQFSSDTGLFEVQAPVPLRPYRTFTKSERSSPAISGSELRHLEGQPAPEAPMATTSMPLSPSAASALAAPTLRRKGKFCASTKNAPRDNGAQRVSKVPSNDAIHNGYHHQAPEMPLSPSYEWTQKFEQISLQTTRAELLNSQMQNFQDVQRESTKQTNGQMSPREHFAHRRGHSEYSTLGSSYNHMIDYNQQMSNSVPRDLNVQIPMLPNQASNGFESSPQQSQQQSNTTGALRQLRQVQSWSQAPTGYNGDYTVSPSQIHPNWLEGLPENNGGYFQNPMPYPAPTSQGPSAIFSQDDLSNSCYTPSMPLSRHPTQNFHPLNSSDEILNVSSFPQAPHTPPPSDPSASPPTPEVTPSPQKQTRASRRGRTNGPRLQKSTAALKTQKSLGQLKAPKSAGNLRNRKSVGAGLNSHMGGGPKSPIKKESQQGVSFGFMNFTPQDSAKILTGVAPSGSSKTKARRELEATEEKRRMSLAAIKAIEVAGGDSEALKAQLFIDDAIAAQ